MTALNQHVMSLLSYIESVSVFFNKSNIDTTNINDIQIVRHNFEHSSLIYPII